MGPPLQKKQKPKALRVAHLGRSMPTGALRPHYLQGSASQGLRPAPIPTSLLLCQSFQEGTLGHLPRHTQCGEKTAHSCERIRKDFPLRPGSLCPARQPDSQGCPSVVAEQSWDRHRDRDSGALALWPGQVRAVWLQRLWPVLESWQGRGTVVSGGFRMVTELGPLSKTGPKKPWVLSPVEGHALSLVVTQGLPKP